MIRRIEYRQIAEILAMFLMVQFGGLLLASVSISSAQPVQITGSAQALSVGGALWYTVGIIAAAAVLLLVIRFYHGDLLFRAIEALMIIFSSFFVFLLLITYLFNTISPNAAISVSAMLSVLLVLAKNKVQRLRNATVIIASVGVGVVLGASFSFIGAVAFMGLVAIYDYLAVFVTRHMISLAKAISSRNLAFLISSTDIESIPKSQFGKKELQEYRKSILSRNPGPEFSDILRTGRVPIVSQIQLGAGDLGIPLMVAVSALSINYLTSIIVVVGASAGLIATMAMLKRYQVPLPAIPPLFSFVIMALGLEDAFMYSSVLIGAGLIALGVLTIWVMIFTAIKDKTRNAKQHG